MFKRKHLILIGIILLLLVATVTSVYVYQVNKPTEPKTVYMLPKPNEERVTARVLPAKLAPKPQVRTPILEETDIDTYEETQVEEIIAPELEEFLALAEEYYGEGEEKPFILMELTPDEMAEYLHENYHPTEYMDFLSSGEGLDWFRKVIAPDFPRLDDPFVTACRGMYSFDDDRYGTCVEDRYRELVAMNREAYDNGIRNINDFITKLNPAPSERQGDVGASVIPVSPSPEERFRKR